MAITCSRCGEINFGSPKKCSKCGILFYENEAEIMEHIENLKKNLYKEVEDMLTPKINYNHLSFQGTGAFSL